MAYNIIMYETPSGQPVIQNFIDGLQPQTQAKIVRLIELLENAGPKLSMPHTKPLGSGLYELRVKGRQEVRIFYVFAVGADIYLLHAFQKKSQATPKKELALAQQRQAEL
jgi:phage-related protein